MISETKSKIAKNQWLGIDAGKSAKDKVLFLSLVEVVQYFGDSG